MTPYDEGLVAASAGLSDDHNPYAEGTSSHDEWMRGHSAYKGPSALGGPEDDPDED